MTHYLTPANWIRAVWLWSRGNDTASIAKVFDVPEALIWRELPKWRAKYPTVQKVA